MAALGVVCIHGAGLNSTLWDAFKRECGSEVLAVDFPNRGEPGGRNKNLGFPDYVETVTEQIKNWNGESFVLVGHSLGALVGIKVAEAFKTQVTAMVAIASVVPKSGNSFASALPFPQNYLLPRSWGYWAPDLRNPVSDPPFAGTLIRTWPKRS